MPKVSSAPATLRPYLFHGLDLSWSDGAQQATGDCPFCGREGKLSVSVETGQWRCWVCGEGTKKGGGNVWTFIRLLWDRSDAATNGASDELARERKLLWPDTVTHFGAAQSVVTGEWLLPAHSPDGKLSQLYRWAKGSDGKRRLLATPDLKHQLFGVKLYNRDSEDVMLCEGPWDAMALWEVAGKRANVLAAPGCNVFHDWWLPLFAGKAVHLCYDSDHPVKAGNRTLRAGFDGMRRIVAMLAKYSTPPKSVDYLEWGREGYDPDRPSGWDVRDHLSQGKNLDERNELLAELIAKFAPAPREWGEFKSAGGVSVEESLSCDSWAEVVKAWRKAFRWRQGLEDVLAVMLAVAISTEQVGDQLFFQVIGDAGNAKTKLCEAMLVSKTCYPLEHLTGFHSGWKDADGNDYSLINRINRKTLITPEGDVLMSSPRFVEIMSQQRRIFDGTSGASFKNRKEDMRYTGLRTPWIIAGTPALMDTDQSRLGDRFLRICVDRPNEDERRDILRQVGYTAMRSVTQTSNCKAEGQQDAAVSRAYRLTGGYVDHLRANAPDLLSAVSTDDEAVVERCMALAEFVADLRARPHPDSKRETEATKELPSRLMSQFVRLGSA